MKNKYLFILVCLVVLLAVVLPSCGGGDKNPTTTTKSTAITTTTPLKTTSPTTTTSGGADNSLGNILGLGSGIDTLKFDMSITATGSEKITMTIWQKKQKIREEMSTQGMTVVIIFNPEEKVMYMYYPAQKMATKSALDSNMVPDSPLGEASNILDYSPNIVGTETIDGKDCAVVAYEMPGEGSVKMWIWKDKGFPLKMEMTANGSTTTIEYGNIDFSDIPDSVFELPDDVQIIDSGA